MIFYVKLQVIFKINKLPVKALGTALEIFSDRINLGNE